MPTPPAEVKPPIGRRIETWWRGLRPYVDPKQIMGFQKVVARLGAPSGERPVAWCDFRSPELDTVAGCHAFQLAHDLLEAGYEPVFRRNYNFLANIPSKSHKRLLLDLPIALADEEPSDACLTLIDQASTAERTRAPRVGLLEYAARKARDGEIALPYCACPPTVATAVAPEVALDAPRPVGVCFAGTTDPNHYDQSIMRQRYGMLTRLDSLETLLTAPSLPEPRRVRSEEDLALFEEGAPFVLAIDGVHIPAPTWLTTLSRVDFWLALPGTRMPLCHNLIEAMSVGAVPILEYEQHTTPALEDGVNCFAFRGADGLAEAVRRALGASQETRRQMRAAAYAFYQEHLAPGTLAERLLASEQRQTTLLLNDHLAPRDQSVLRLNCAG